MVLIIDDSWKGKPLIACKVDLLLISEKTKNKYSSSFIGEAKNVPFILI